MRVALCLSGIPRGVYCHEFVQRISQYYETNLFIFYWNDGEDIRKHSYNGKPTFDFYPKSFALPGVELQYKSDKFASHIENFQHQYNQIEESKRVRPDLGVFGMTYGIYQANLMREYYEIENNIKFDCVFRIRFEAAFREIPGPEKFWNIRDYDMDVLWIPDVNVNLETGMNDQLAFSSPKIMSYYSRIYEHLVRLSNQHMHSPETIFHHYLTSSFFKIHSQAKVA